MNEKIAKFKKFAKDNAADIMFTAAVGTVGFVALSFAYNVGLRKGCIVGETAEQSKRILTDMVAYLNEGDGVQSIVYKNGQIMIADNAEALKL